MFSNDAQDIVSGSQASRRSNISLPSMKLTNVDKKVAFQIGKLILLFLRKKLHLIQNVLLECIENYTTFMYTKEKTIIKVIWIKLIYFIFLFRKNRIADAFNNEERIFSCKS